MKVLNNGSHPLNLLFRFVLEVLTLLSIALWAWHLHTSWVGFVLAVLIPMLISVIWGTFTVPDDPSRSGKAPVPIAGWMRLLLELALFFFGIWCLYALERPVLSIILACLVILHYAVSTDRMRWLLTPKSRYPSGNEME